MYLKKHVTVPAKSWGIPSFSLPGKIQGRSLSFTSAWKDDPLKKFPEKFSTKVGVYNRMIIVTIYCGIYLTRLVKIIQFKLLHRVYPCSTYSTFQSFEPNRVPGESVSVTRHQRKVKIKICIKVVINTQTIFHKN